MGREILRGDVFFADLSPVTGSEQGGVRPVLVIQNDAGNTFAPTTIVAAITAKKTKRALPTHVAICKEAAGEIFSRAPGESQKETVVFFLFL